MIIVILLLTLLGSGKVKAVTAKSVTRTGIRLIYKEHNRSLRFFCANIQHLAFMAGLLGASSDAPVTLYAGHASPNNLATNLETGISTGGSKIQGAYTMAIYRLALLSGGSIRLSACRIRQYRTITSPSYSAATAEAKRLHAVVVCRYPSTSRRAAQ